MPRNLFTGDGDEPVEVPQGEQSPQSEIPVENLGDLYEDTLEDLLEKLESGEISVNDVRVMQGLPPIEDVDLLARLNEDDVNWFNNLRRRSLEGRRDPSRWERG